MTASTENLVRLRVEPMETNDLSGDADVYAPDGLHGAAWFHSGYWWGRWDGGTGHVRAINRDAVIEKLTGAWRRSQ